MTTGVSLLLITALGWVSNMLNWKFLNSKLIHYLYYLGAFVHESSHALACVLTRTKVTEFSVFSDQPHVTHEQSKIPVIGNALIAIAPLFGGLGVLYVITHYVLGGSIVLVTPSLSLNDIALAPILFLKQFHFFAWQSWVLLLLLLNVGAMIGPSFKDLKNIWFILLLLAFIRIPAFDTFFSTAISLILSSIMVQIILISIVALFRFLSKTKQP